MLKRTTVVGALLMGLALIPLRAEVIEQVVVKVNGNIVTMGEFEKRQLDELRSKRELAQLPPNSPEIQKAVEDSAPAVILSAVDDLLLLQRAKEHGWALTEDKFKEIIASIRKENNLESDEAFKKALEAEGYTEADLRKNIEREMLIKQVTQADVSDKVTVSDQEIQAYYDDHVGEFTSPTEVTLRELMIPIPTTNGSINVGQAEEIGRKAEAVRQRLLAGESFAKVAAEVSSSESKNNGGLVGPLNLEAINPALQKIIGALKIGGISEVLKSQTGYQILMLESRTEAKVRTVQEARNDVYVRIAQQKARVETYKYLDQLRAQANIVWHQDELHNAYEKALKDRRAALAQGAIPQSS
jgi:peptidyl-prolyl cis-trans isomerase SurA